MNIENQLLPFESETIDLIIANQVLEHTKEIYWIHHEIFRTLKVGGYLYVGVPNILSLHNRILGLLGIHPTGLKMISTHVRGFSKKDMILFYREIAGSFLTIEQFYGSQFYPFPRRIPRPLAKAFPSFAFSNFLLIRKTGTCEGEFIRWLSEDPLETNFYEPKDAERRSLLDRLSSISGLVVRQLKEWGEILSGFETRNRYSISDESGRNLYLAAEEAGSPLIRWFLKALRPFTIAVLTEDGQEVLRVARPFRFYFHRAEVVGLQGQPMGVIERRFSLLRRVYSFLDRSGAEIYQLFGPVLHPWTFKIRKDGVECGKITKKWGGLMKEGFTDADSFGVMFPADGDVESKALLLGAVFLIDFVHFENKGNN